MGGCHSPILYRDGNFNAKLLIPRRDRDILIILRRIVHVKFAIPNIQHRPLIAEKNVIQLYRKGHSLIRIQSNWASVCSGGVENRFFSLNVLNLDEVAFEIAVSVFEFDFNLLARLQLERCLFLATPE